MAHTALPSPPTSDQESMPSAPVRPRYVTWLHYISLIIIFGLSFYLVLAYWPGQTIIAFGQPMIISTAAPTWPWAGHAISTLYGTDAQIGPRLWGFLEPRLTYGGTAAFTPPNGSEAHAIVSGLVRDLLNVSAVILFGIFAATLIESALYHNSLRRAIRTARRLTISALAVLLLGVGLLAITGISSFTKANSLSELYGNPTAETAPDVKIAPDTTVDAVTAGDSVLAGKGLNFGLNPDHLTSMCGRSPEAPATAIQKTIQSVLPGFGVENIACSSATIHEGMLGDQRGHPSMELLQYPQLSLIESLPNVKFVFLSIGADDVEWGSQIIKCFMVANCEPLVRPQFESELTAFRDEYRQFLDRLKIQLDKLDHEVAVVVNTMYNPFDPSVACPGIVAHVNGQKYQLSRANIDFLLGVRSELNTVLADGAQNHGFIVANPDFSGNALCDKLPYVQDVNSGSGAFHPNQLGALWIAATDLAAVPNWRDIAKGLSKSTPDIAAGAAHPASTTAVTTSSTAPSH
ncbi:hypothetical protein HJC99_04010 [Candidatus Saccharibacteria bacterium]|nr:hypothetical protein [Candidatus Saccharibacteria bacterium]